MFKYIVLAGTSLATLSTASNLRSESALVDIIASVPSTVGSVHGHQYQQSLQHHDISITIPLINRKVFSESSLLQLTPTETKEMKK